MSQISIRAGRLSDLDAMRALEHAVFATDRLSRRSLRAFILDRRRPLLVAVSDRALAGYALIALRKRSHAARLYSIAVDPRSGRGGVGSALMGACERYAVAHGCDLLRLEVRADNGAAITLYERLGFRQFGQYESYYADGAKALRFEKPIGKQAWPAAPRNKR